MKLKQTRVAMLALLAVVACAKDETTIENQEAQIPISEKSLVEASVIRHKISGLAQKGKKVSWSMMTNQELWSAIQDGEQLCTIGFGDHASDFDRSKSRSASQLQAKILQLIANSEQKGIDKILLKADVFLNQVDVRIEKQETIIALRRLGYVRYVEPADFRLENNMDASKDSSSSSGCGLESEVISTSDYTTITPNAKAPWAFYKHNIPAAWNYSTGQGVTLGIVDTGLSTVNSLFNGSFNNGLSSGRVVQKYGVYVDSIWPWTTGYDGANDKCGHGTSMVSVAAAPRNDKGQPVGVAYNCNLISYRAAYNVVLDGYHELEGVKTAYTNLANNANVRVISMSMGNIISSGKIEDAIKYAYSKGKLMFCAAGTSTSFTSFAGVIFPAWMPEVVAVTGIKDASTYQACDVCHTGSKVEFTIMMQRVSSGNKIPVNSYYEGQGDYVGGSSVATATTSGIATLVWAKNPSWTRGQVLQKLRQSAQFYTNRHPEFGYGMPDALKAMQ